MFSSPALLGPVILIIGLTVGYPIYWFYAASIGEDLVTRSVKPAKSVFMITVERRFPILDFESYNFHLTTKPTPKKHVNPLPKALSKELCVKTKSTRKPRSKADLGLDDFSFQRVFSQLIHSRSKHARLFPK